MADLDIPANDRLLEVIKRLAIKLYGDDSEASRQRVVETALGMRCLWSRSIEKGQQETNEAVTEWEFPQSLGTKDNNGTIREWLFRR